MLAMLLALSASAGWGTADFLGGLTTRRLSILAVSLISQSVGLAFMLGLLASDLHSPPSSRSVLLGLVAGLLSTVGLAALYSALSIGPMGVVAPLVATSGIVPVAAGLLRGDRPAPVQLLGIALAIAGVVLAARHRDEAGARIRPRAVGLAVLAALTLGSLVVALQAASRVDAIWPVLLVRLTAVVLMAVAVLVVRPSMHLERGQLRKLAAVGILDNGANLLFVLAAQRGLLSLVAVLASLYPVATVLLARVVLKERLSGVQMAGVITALTGVAMIALG
jgi:drug/metabolite transporter (DMT)-like permease